MEKTKRKIKKFTSAWDLSTPQPALSKNLDFNGAVKNLYTNVLKVKTPTSRIKSTLNVGAYAKKFGLKQEGDRSGSFTRKKPNMTLNFEAIDEEKDHKAMSPSYMSDTEEAREVSSCDLSDSHESIKGPLNEIHVKT
jgi:hypothetical protein